MLPGDRQTSGTDRRHHPRWAPDRSRFAHSADLAGADWINAAGQHQLQQIQQRDNSHHLVVFTKGRLRSQNVSYYSEPSGEVHNKVPMLVLVNAFLTDAGYRVVEAKGGRQALEACRRLHGGIDLLLTDVIMPNMHGRELYEKLKAKRTELKAVFMSGYTDDVLDRIFSRFCVGK